VNIDICETEREAEDTVKTLLELAGILWILTLTGLTYIKAEQYMVV
jgi:hypothetical protein